METRTRRFGVSLMPRDCPGFPITGPLYVLEDVLAGGSPMSSAIADEMKIRIETVSFHLGNIYRKFHVRIRTEAVLKYLGRVPEPPTY
jgi:hypothetical protein